MKTEQLTHSPGPWTAEEWKIGQGQEPRTEMVLHNNVHQIGKLIWSDAADKPWDISKAEQQANARLIAAAPDLLEALRVIANCRGYEDGMIPLGTYEMDMVRAAIAKATGE